MKVDQKNWLPHLKNIPEDIRGYKTCTYLMALEGWRRGLELKFHIKRGVTIPPSIRYSLSDGKSTHYFNVARGDKVTKSARRICTSKPNTYAYLRENNIPIPEGKDFDANTEDYEILKYVEKLGFPLVIKPTNGASGVGVITDIKSLDEFKEAMKEVRQNLGYKSVIVERFIKGADYRVYVVADKVVGIYKRVEANIVGNGKDTIDELINKKNKIRGINPFIYNRLIKKDKNLIEYLKKRGLDLESVPSENQKVFLRRQGEYLGERDPVDITDIVSDEIKDIAVRAMNSIPGLTHCDVDMLVNEESGNAFVNEINSRPQISNHLFPLEGLARDIPKEIIDYYFPETKNGPRNDNLYYDFSVVYEAFKNMSIEEIPIPNIPMNHNLTRFRLKGKLKNVGFERWIRRYCGRMEINGYIKHLKNGETSINVSGTNSDLMKLRNTLNNDMPNEFKIDEINEYESNNPLKLGFVYLRSIKPRKELRKQIKHLELREKELQNEILKLEKECEYKTNQYLNIIESKSWKMTKYFRKLGGIFKK